MVVDAQDPVTGTKWLDVSNLGGSAMTMVGGILGLAGLFLAALIAWHSVTPRAANAVESASGGIVNAGGGGKRLV